jgi:hypothetical protein
MVNRLPIPAWTAGSEKMQRANIVLHSNTSTSVLKKARGSDGSIFKLLLDRHCGDHARETALMSHLAVDLIPTGILGCDSNECQSREISGEEWLRK